MAPQIGQPFNCLMELISQSQYDLEDYRIQNLLRKGDLLFVSIPSTGGAGKGAAFFSVQMALFQHCTHKLNSPEPLAEPLPDPVCTRFALCQDCPYPSHGFICWSDKEKCLRTRMREINAEEECPDVSCGTQQSTAP